MEDICSSGAQPLYLFCEDAHLLKSVLLILFSGLSATFN